MKLKNIKSLDLCEFYLSERCFINKCIISLINDIIDHKSVFGMYIVLEPSKISLL